jgi:hypothetical protein
MPYGYSDHIINNWPEPAREAIWKEKAIHAERNAAYWQRKYQQLTQKGDTND